MSGSANGLAQKAVDWHGRSGGVVEVISVDCPEVEFRDFYLRSVARTRDPDLRTRLESEVDWVVERSERYVELAEIARLHEFGFEPPGQAAPCELEDVYDRVLVKGKERPTYDRVRTSARLGICPMCGDRKVKTVDHLLPKSRFPELSAFEKNLVPCCSDCNMAKKAKYPDSAQAQFFHPYFDRWDDWDYLRADVEVSEAVSADFRIVQAPEMPDLEFNRACHHFEELELNLLFTELSAVELVDKKGVLAHHLADGEEALRHELQLLSYSATRRHWNSWRAALFRALAASDAFVEGGVELIPE